MADKLTDLELDLLRDAADRKVKTMPIDKAANVLKEKGLINVEVERTMFEWWIVETTPAGRTALAETEGGQPG